MTAATSDLVDPRDPPLRQIAKLQKICDALMRRVEETGADRSAAFGQFQRSVLLETQVRERTRDLERALDLLHLSNASLEAARADAERARSDLTSAVESILDGFGLFDADDRLVLFNARFCLQIPETRAILQRGLAFQDYVLAISRSSQLALPPGTSREDWALERLARHDTEHVMFNVRLTGDRWIQVSESRMSSGQTVILQTDVSDMIRAERKEHDRQLDDHAALTRDTLEHMPQGIGVFDAKGRLAYFNQRLASMLSIPLNRLRPGLDVEVLTGWTYRAASILEKIRIDDLHAWFTQPAGRQPLQFSFRKGGGQWFDVEAREMTGGGFVISITDVSGERAAASELAGANQVLEERVTLRTLELEDALERAERANASRSRFVAAASHDLLQPLSAAKLYLSSASEELSGNPVRGVVDKAHSALLSVQEIIEALLDISRLESDTFRPDLRAVDLDHLFGTLESDFAPVAGAKNVGLKFRRSGCQVRSDPAYLRRVLQNLIGNAVRYTTQGRVLVAARPRDGAIQIGIWDTGPGIAESEQQNVFKEFHRIDRKASATEGLGLGLAIVERACAMLGHGLELRSTPGRGTVFLLTISRVLPQDRPAVPVGPSPRAGQPQRFSQHRALVIENDLEFRAALCTLLGKWGVTVASAGAPDEALEALREMPRPPTVLFLDFQLDDGQTGFDALEAIRSQTGTLPFRVVTADRSERIVQKAQSHGGDVLQKPLDPLAIQLFLTSIS